MFLSLEPETAQRAADRGNRPRYVGMTWGVWANVLVGMVRFCVKYPGLDFEFGVSVQEGGFRGVGIAGGELREWGVGDALGECLKGEGEGEGRHCLRVLGGEGGGVEE